MLARVMAERSDVHARAHGRELPHMRAHEHEHAQWREQPQARTQVRVAGVIALRALRASGGATLPVPGFEATPFRLAAGEIIWTGSSALLHPRVALVPERMSEQASARRSDHAAQARDVWLDIKNAIPYLSETVGGSHFNHIECLTPLARATLGLMHSAIPSGFAALLCGQPLVFPLSHRADAARALAAACATNDMQAFTQAAARLIGVGSGLTPSGDDFVGAALFARRLVVAPAHRAAWKQCADAVLVSAAQRTHVVSHALLADLAVGASYAPLHQLSDALIEADEAAALNAMRALVTIGHSSGWDMLAGFIAGAAGCSAPEQIHSLARNLPQPGPPRAPLSY